jgi:glycosyltransferase involved in cell wall biosynthesis
VNDKTVLTGPEVNKVFFIQQSPALAGSQKSLLRLMLALNACWRPVLISGAEGSLTAATSVSGIPVVVCPFLSSRSLKARLFGNRRFGQAVAEQCRFYIQDRCLVHANDHIQSLSALAVAAALKVPSVLTVRSSGMSKRDFFKYKCQRHEIVVAVGQSIFQRVSAWCPVRNLKLVENGIAEAEIKSAIHHEKQFPRSVVVPGSVHQGKGWRDLTDALVLLEKKGLGSDIEFALLGNDCGQNVKEVVGAERLRQFRIKHLPLTADFQETVSEHSFAIHPSRSESFGMALLEVLAAGVPVLTGRTGVATQVVTDSRFLFEPKNSSDLAEKLGSLMIDFSGADRMVNQAQEIIRRQYCIARTAAQYTHLYDGLISG